MFTLSRPGSSAGPRRTSWERSASQHMAILCPGRYQAALCSCICPSPVGVGGPRADDESRNALSTRGTQPRSAEDDPVHTGQRATVEKQQLRDGASPAAQFEGREGCKARASVRQRSSRRPGIVFCVSERRLNKIRKSLTYLDIL